MSADGRYVAFDSAASNLVAGDSNSLRDTFVYDRQSDGIERVSLGAGGTQGDNNSYAPSLRVDGRYAAFASEATNLVADDTNGCQDIFVYDRQSDGIERVSVDGTGTEADNCSSNPSLSADGRIVAFASPATNLVAGDTSGWQDIFVYDRQSDGIERVSVNAGGAQGGKQ